MELKPPQEDGCCPPNSLKVPLKELANLFSGGSGGSGGCDEPSWADDDCAYVCLAVKASKIGDCAGSGSESGTSGGLSPSDCCSGTVPNNLTLDTTSSSCSFPISSYALSYEASGYDGFAGWESAPFSVGGTSVYWHLRCSGDMWSVYLVKSDDTTVYYTSGTNSQSCNPLDLQNTDNTLFTSDIDACTTADWLQWAVTE